MKKTGWMLLIGLLFLICSFSYPSYPRRDSSAYHFVRNLCATEKLNPNILQLTLNTYRKMAGLGLDRNGIVTIVDYSKPSSEKRLWVIDLKRLQLLFYTYVSHGEASGLANAYHFSNEVDSLSSSIGVYLTGNTYYGRAGYSLRLYGLDKGFNDHAFKRGIVMHPSWYVSQSFAERYGRIGLSLGCLALDRAIAGQIINTIKGGTIIIAYYPDNHWLKRSRFL